MSRNSYLHNPKSLRNAHRILALLMGTPRSPEQIARRRRVSVAYVCGLFDGWTGDSIALAYLDDPRTEMDLDYLEGRARGEQLVNRAQAAEEAA